MPSSGHCILEWCVFTTVIAVLLLLRKNNEATGMLTTTLQCLVTLTHYETAIFISRWVQPQWKYCKQAQLISRSKALAAAYWADSFSQDESVKVRLGLHKAQSVCVSIRKCNTAKKRRVLFFFNAVLEVWSEEQHSSIGLGSHIQ